MMLQVGKTTKVTTRLWMRFSPTTSSKAMLHVSSLAGNGTNKIALQRLRESVGSTPVFKGSFQSLSTIRCFSSSSTDSLCPKQIQIRLNEFQELFVEARMCIDDVKDSFGTVYYEEDADDARDAVDAAIKNFEALLHEITDIDEKNKVLRSNGLKVEQLKGELELTLSGGHDHH
eukprot:CAMPEP_0116129118 /NCGR_PEP_ID=MMETSP0329-20121206/7759_1 /TAXON_ID=697910 /ORGANISM="Pseudo-nitzschia arenysensis, Strain B593" /LENGTH=173 /DNA_ID=CAMNT_0003623375 /DNA_START=27 /DNA_END=548 /DNA_ORIENTATION=-